MFNSNKKLTLIDYQHSYFYQQKRKNQRRKWFKYLLLLVLLAALTAVIVPLARATNLDHELASQTPSTTQSSVIHGPQLIFSHPNDRKRVALPMNLNLCNYLMALSEISVSLRLGSVQRQMAIL